MKIISNGKLEAKKAFAFAANSRNLDMAETANLVKNIAVPLAPRRTGRLQGSIRTDKFGYNRYKVIAGYEGDRPYARWQHYGTVKNVAHKYFYKAGGRAMSRGKGAVRKQIRGAALKSGYSGL